MIFLRVLVLSFILMGLSRPLTACAENDRFDRWLTGLRQEALRQGISAVLLDEVLSGLRPSARVIEMDRRQAEFRMGFNDYLKLMVSPSRIAEGRARLVENRAASSGNSRAIRGLSGDHRRALGN